MVSKMNSTIENITINTVQELVDHNQEMVKWCKERNEDSTLYNYYEGKLDAYTNVLEMLTDIQRIMA